MTLWHYTCRHSAAHLGDRGVLQPIRRLGDPERLAKLSHDWNSDLIWLTDLDYPMRDALGLSSYVTGCDRTERRYRVLDESTAVHWMRVRRRFPDATDLEQAPGAMPMHWWVSFEPVPVVFDPLVAAA